MILIFKKTMLVRILMSFERTQKERNVQILNQSWIILKMEFRLNGLHVVMKILKNFTIWKWINITNMDWTHCK